MLWFTGAAKTRPFDESIHGELYQGHHHRHGSKPSWFPHAVAFVEPGKLTPGARWASGFRWTWLTLEAISGRCTFGNHMAMLLLPVSVTVLVCVDGMP